MPLGCLIGLPCRKDEAGKPYFGAGTHFSMCLQSLAPPMSYQTSHCIVAGKQIDDARNEICEAALRAKAEHILFLDTDVLFPNNTFQQLLLRQRNNPDHKIVSGVYWSKGNPTFPLIFHEAGRGSNMNWVVGDYIEAPYATGMGLVLIHTDVIKAIEPPWFKINYGLTVDPETGRGMTASLTEDLYFCEKATAKGYKIMVDTGIQAGHYHESGQIFGLNEAMPQARRRPPKESNTLYIGDMLAGGEPAHVLSSNPALLPTWIGTPEKVPTNEQYDLVRVKRADVDIRNLDEVVREWVRVMLPSGRIEVMHPDYASWLNNGLIFKSEALYNEGPIESAMNNAGLLSVSTEKKDNWFTVRASKPADRNPLVSIIIPAHNLEDMTRQCIDSIRERTAHKGYTYEIILVDNGSDPALKRMGDKQIRLEENKSFGEASMMGVDTSSTSAYILFMNNDTVVVDKDWLNNLLKRIRGHGDIAAVGPKQITPHGTIYHTEIGFSPDLVPYHLFNGFSHDHVQVQAEKEVRALNFGCCLVRREAFEQLGGFDSRFGGIGNYEDIDWCLRARQAKMKLIYTPSSSIVHFGARTQANDPKESRKWVAVNRRKFVKKWKNADRELFE